MNRRLIFLPGFALLSTLLCILSLNTLLPAQISEWQVMQDLRVPEYNYSFLAATPQGDLLAATFNSSAIGTKQIELPALLVRHPASDTPEVIPLARCTFEPQRGYGGIACDSLGNFYLSADTGTAGTCFIRRFRPDGSPDLSFGQGGQILPNRRTLGLEVLGRYLFVSVSGGTILLIDADSGQPMGEMQRCPEDYIRDIAVDPKSMRIFGVSKGAVLTWGRGAPWSPMAYQYYQLTPTRGELRAGEGISIDPIRRTVLISPIPGNTLFEIHGNGVAVPTSITTAASDAHLCDSVLSFDGRVLYVSDIRARRIHVLERGQAQLASAANARAGASIATAIQQNGSAEKVNWYRSYTDVVRQAREAREPMVVYFGRQDIPKCRDTQENVLLTDTFNQHARNFICVYEDVGSNQLIAYRFGAYRVPYIAVLDRNGDTVDEFVYDIDSDRLFETMRKVGG